LLEPIACMELFLRKAYGRLEVHAHSYFTSQLDKCDRSDPRLDRSFCTETTQEPFQRKSGGAQKPIRKRFGECKMLLPLPGTEPRFLCFSVLSLSTIPTERAVLVAVCLFTASYCTGLRNIHRNTPSVPLQLLNASLPSYCMRTTA